MADDPKSGSGLGGVEVDSYSALPSLNNNLLKDTSDKEWQRALDTQDIYFKTFAAMNVSYATQQRQSQQLQYQLTNQYFPYDPNNNPFLANAMEIGIPLVASGLAGKAAMSATGSFLRSVPWVAGTAIASGAAAVTAFEPDLMERNQAMSQFMTEGPMNAYWARSNFASSGGLPYNQNSFRADFQAPLNSAANTMGLNPTQLGAGVSDLVRMGLVSGTDSNSGRNAATVINEATVIFKALESFFGSVDIAGLTQKIQAMSAAGFTPENMVKAGSALNASVFANAPADIRDAITSGAVQYGGAFSNMGLSAGLGASTYISSMQTASKSFGKLDSYNQYLFRSPEGLGGTISNAMTSYMQTYGMAGLMGGGDMIAGLSKISQKYDLSNPEDLRRYKRWQWEASNSTSANTVVSTMMSQAENYANTFGVDIRSALEMITGDPQQAEAIMIQAESMSSQIGSAKTNIKGLFDRGVIRSGRDMNATTLSSNLWKASLGQEALMTPNALALSIAEDQLYGAGGVDADLYAETASERASGGLFNFERGLAEVGGLGRRARGLARRAEAFRTGTTTKASFNAAREYQSTVLAWEEGAREIVNAGGVDDDTKNIINVITQNASVRRQINEYQGRGGGGTFSPQDIITFLQKAGLSGIADRVQRDPKLLGRIIEGMRATGDTKIAGELSGMFYNGFDIGASARGIDINQQLGSAGEYGSIEGRGFAANAALVGAYAGAAAVPLYGAAKVAGMINPVFGAGVATVANIATGLGFLGVGASMAANAVYGANVSREEAKKIDESLYGNNLIVEGTVGVITILVDSFRSGFGRIKNWLTSMNRGAILAAVTETFSDIVYNTVKNACDGKRREDYGSLINNSQQFVSVIIAAMSKAAETNSSEAEAFKVLIDWFKTEEGNNALDNLVAVFFTHFKDSQTPIGKEDYKAQVLERVKAFGSDFTEESAKEEKYTRNVFTKKGLRQRLMVNASTTADDARQQKNIISEFSDTLSAKYGLTGDATTDILRVISSEKSAATQDAEIKGILKNKAKTKISDLDVASKDVKSAFESIATGAGASAAATDQLSSQVADVLFKLKTNKDFKEAMKEIFKDVTIRTD
ncbi:MAG: hypothetical protein WC517_03080 [Patescibacteria group bacterium]